MDELNSSMEEADLSKTLKKLQTLEAEKGDIVLGFIKEKEIIETIHQEQLEQLKVKHEDEIHAVRQEWLREREKLVRESDSRQVDAENHNEKKAQEIEKSLMKKSKGDVKETEEEFKKEKRKLREEYEAVIARKTDEIEELYRENCILRSKSDPGSFEDKNKESNVMINKLQSKINALEEDKLAQIMKLKNEFEVEKAELERKQVREKAEFVKQLTSKYAQQNTNNELEKNKSYLVYKKEMEEKIEIVEKLWEERNTEDRKKMNTRLENEIAMQKRRFAEELQTKLLERDMTIEDLEREKEELSKSVHVERFELAKFYNRELSILNRLDSPTKEDIEVALIDEVAKLRDEQQKVIRSVEKRHKRKMRDFKKSQKPLVEIEEQHKNELDELRNNYEKEKEEFEAKLRNEQLNLLKSFEFEKNDIERYFKQLMDEQGSEFQDEIQEIQSEYEKVKDNLNILEKENDELKNQFVQEKERNCELSDKLQECESQNARLKEEIERDKRNNREPIKEISAVGNDKEGLKQTVEKLSSLNIQLSDELEKERKKCENLLEKVHELEKEQEHLMTRSEADEFQSSESGLELFSSPTEKPDRTNRDSYRSDGSSVEVKKHGEAKKEPSKEDLDMQMKLQDSVQEYLLEIKVLQNAMDEKEMEIKQLKDTFAKEKSDLNEQIQQLNDSLKCAVDEEDGGDEVEDLEELKSRYKKLTDSINQVIKDLANKPSSSKTSGTSHQSSTSEPSSEENVKGFANEINALDELLNDELDTQVKEKLGKKLEELKNNIKRSHELEKLQQQREHEQEKNRYLKELSDERNKELDVSGEVWNAVCEKLGLDKEESKDKLKEMLQEKDDPSGDVSAQKMNSETNGKSDYDENSDDKESNVEKSPDSEELKKLKGENASLQNTLKELETHYEKDKEELMEKLQTQHKEFVLSSEAEVIEKLIKEKSALEEASIVERFNLGSIYYMEMQDELEEILSQRKEDMNKEHKKEKLNIILKFNKDVADLHKLLADKDDNEVKLLQEKNSLAKKILDVQRRMPGDENNNTDDIKAAAKKLESSLPLKKELADLQRQRQDEHEASVQNLEKALDLITDLLKDKNKGDASLHRRYSFASASGQSDEVLPTDSPTGQRSPTSVHESDLSDEEIRTKKDLQEALENLIDNCLSKEKEDAGSDTSSGASSDFESEPNTPPPENEEGVSDSGAESIESECVSIKKTDLDMAMNLERFSLGRIYYNEYKDSLKSALKKLAKVKDMNQDLEDKLASGVKDLVNRTIFGKMIVQSLDIETQTLDVQDPVKKTLDVQDPVKKTLDVQDPVKKKLDKLSDNDDNDISLDTSPEVSDDVSASSEDKDVDFENVEQDRVSSSDHKESDKEDAGTQTDELQDNIKTAEQANEGKGMENKQNAEQDSMSDTAIEEISKEDATTQTEDLQDFPNKEEIKSHNQAADISSKVSPRENEDKNDEIVKPVREPATSHMLDQETPENETALKDGYNNKEPKPAAEEEGVKGLDSKDKDTEKADIEEEQQTKHEDERPSDEDKYATENKENAEQEQNAALEDEKPEDAAKVKQLHTSDDQSKLSKDQGKTSDEDIPASNREELEADDQPESDIETLKRENEKLKDKFNILKALVGKWFVEEIPELRTSDKTKQEEEDARSEAIGDEELKELREEEKFLADEINSVEKQILQLKDLNDANNKKEEENLNAQELLALKQLEKADKALKKEEEKDLIELLKKEKEEVSKKLQELEMEIEEHKGQISNDEESLFDLMSKKLELEERVVLKARELDKNQRKLAQMQDDTEKEKVEDAVHSLAEQKKVLEELQKSPTSTDAQENRLPLNQQPSEVSDSDTRKDDTEPSNLPSKDDHISPQVQELIKAKNNEVKKGRKLAKDVEKARQDKDRYIRMTKDREDRMRPFLKKREKLQNKLGEIEEIADQRGEDEVSSTIKNGASNTPNEISDEKTVPNIKVEDIEREIMKIRDELSTLGKKAKIPLEVKGGTNVLPSNLKELESEKDLIDQQIIEKQSTIENLGSEESKELFDILEAKAGLNVKRLKLQEAFPEGYEELPNEVQEAYELACLEQEIKNALAQLDQEIKGEENNFKEAVIYQRQGKLDDPKSAMAPMLERKQNLTLKLEEISSSLPCGDEAGLVNAEAEQSKSEDASERIREIEDMLRQNEESIKDEPLRAAAELGKLIESKQNKTDELIKAADAVKEKVKMAELKENALVDIPDAILSAIALGRETDEDNQPSFEAVERENDIKERCLELQSLKSEGEDTKHKEDELLNVIEEQTSIEVQPVSDKEQNMAIVHQPVSDKKQNRTIDPLPASVFAENKAIKSKLEIIEGKMEAILNGQSDKENIRPELNDLSFFFQKKAEIEKSIKDYKEFDDLLNQERKLAEALKTAVNKKELEEIEQIIDRKEEEINKLKAKSNEVEEMLQQLNDAKNNDEQDDDKLILEIQEAIKETEQLLLEAQAEKERYYENNNKEESNVKEAMSSLEDDLEETREEMEFVENELEGLRSISEDDNAVSPELLELTKLLNSQKSLKDYLLEIDTKLDDCDDTAKPSLSIEEIQALKDEKRDAERKIKEIQEEKSKFEVELQDEDIQETYASLCEEKSKLEQARNDLLHKIHGSDVFVQMADELEEEKPSEEEQKYYTEALNQMLSDQKTLIKLAEENEKLKEVACRQRELLENLSNSISASLGEGLAQAIKLDSNLDEKESLQLPSTIMDRINNKDESIAEILTDLENENKKLTTLNEDLSNELDHLREKIGETLSDAILQSNSQLLEDKLLAPIDEVISADKTVEEILEEQKDALGRLKDFIGENLTDTLLKPRTDVSGTDDHQDLLKAPKIMNETDEDLQTVIAAYEFELDNLGQRNDVLQNMLGNDLVHALLDMDQDQKNKQIPEYVSALAEKGKRPMQDYGGLEDSQSHRKETSEAKERPYVEEDHAGEETNLESEEARNLQLSTDLKPANKSKNVDGLTDKQESEHQYSEDRSLPKPKGSIKSEEMCSEIPKSSQQPLIESDVEKYGMTAPVRMVKDNKTLGEVIKDYENELDTLKSRLGPDLYKEILGAGILDTDDDGENLVTEENEIETKESKKPSNDSAKNKEARKDSDKITDVYPDEQKGLKEQSRKLHDKLEGKDQLLPTDVHNINDEDKNTGEEYKENVDEEGKSDGKATEEKPLSSKVTEHQGRQQKSQKPSLAAPKKMIEENQSLADVIQGYENDLETLKSRLGPELFQDILVAGEQYDAPGRSEAQSEEAQQDADSERSGDGVALEEREDSTNAVCESKDERENLPSFETSKDDLQRKKAALQPGGLDQTQFAATGKGQADELEEMGAVTAKDDGNSEDREDLENVNKEKGPTSVVKQKKGSEGKVKKPSLVAPTRMMEENQTLAAVVEGYENDLETLKSRLGPELFQDILDASKQYDAPGRSEAQSEEAQQEADSERSGDGVALEERQASIKTSKDDLQRRKTAHQPDGQDQTQFAATGKGQADEFDEMGAVTAKDDGTSEDREDLEDVRKEKAPTSALKQKKGSEVKAKKPSLAAPTRMMEENQTLAAVVEGYENDLDILKSRLGPELYGKILDAGKLANAKLLRSEKEPDSFAEKKEPGISGKAEVKPEDTIHGSQENKESESMPSAGVLYSQEKASKDDAPTPAESGDRAKGSTVSDVKDNLEDEGMNEEQKSELSAHANKPAPFIRGSEAQADQFEISAPKQMIDENKTLGEVIKGYESDLETLKSKLGPQLVNSLLATSNLGDEGTKRESIDRIDQSNMLTEKQPSTLRIEDSKTESDSIEELGKDSDHEENMKENDQEKYLEHSLSEGEAYLSDGELYESFNVPNIKKEGTKSEANLDGKLTFSAPSAMAKEGKTLGEVLESYENDLEALKSKLGPKLFEHVLEIAKHDSELATAGIVKDGYDGKTDNRTKEPAQKKAAEDIDGEKEYGNNLDYQEEGKYDGEISAKEKDHPETEATNLESGERALTSIGNNGPELLSKEHDLVAPKQMLEENKTLEEIIESYENDLRDFRESLGPQLCDAILNARKGINESSDETTLTLGKEDFDEPDMDYLEQTTDEKGKKAANWKAEIGKVILESQPQQGLKDAEDNKKDIGETSETNRHSDTQDEQQLQNEDGKEASDFDKDAEDDQLAEQNITTQKLEAPKMIAQGKKLDEIIGGYENELGTLKSRIGPILYEDIVTAGKPAQTYEKAELLAPKKPEVSEKMQASEVALKEKEDEKIEGGHEEQKGKEERPSADIAIQKKSEEETKDGTSAEESDKNIIGEKDQVANQEQAAKEDNINGLQLKAAEEMLAQNKTLEEVVQGYEKDLATLNSKLGPELFQSILETATKDDAAKASYKENAFDDGLSETQTTDKKIKNAEASIVEPDSEIGEAIRESNEQQVPIVSKATHEQGEEVSPGKDGEVDVKSQAGLSTGSSKDSIDFNGNEKQPSHIKEQLKAPILLAEQGATLQEIIEKYEKDLDTFNSKLGPNLAKAIVEARGKECLSEDDKDEQPIEKVDQDLNQDKKEGIENVDHKETVRSMDDGTHEKPDAQDKDKSDDTKKAEEIEEQQEMDYFLDMFENDVTLEDEVKKLKKESKDLKEKLGPNLTKILLEEEEKGKGKKGEKRKGKEVGDSETKDMEIPCSVSEKHIGSPRSGKGKEEMLDAEENVSENQEVKCENGKKERITEDDVSPSGSKQKTFMAPKIMEAQNAPLEEVIQNYEHDLSVLKKALGPSLVNLLLNDKATPTADNKPDLTDASEDKETPKLTQKDKEKTRGLEAETNRANKEDSISGEQRRIDEEDKQEKTKKKSEQDEMKETEEECLSQTEPKESEELEKILSPLLNGDKDKSLEDILKTLHSDLDLLTSKLGSNLSKSLLTMDTDSYNVSNDKDKDIGDKDGGVGNQLDLETKGKNEAKSENVEDQEEGKDDKKKDEKLGADTAGEEMEELGVIDRMEENSQTLEEVIKQYENNLEKYESSLGPYLSKAILSNEFTPEEAEQSQEKSNVDDKSAEEVPLDVHEDENEDKIKVSKLDGYLKLLDKGKTLEDVLMQYDPVHEVAPSTHGDENGPPITDENEPYGDQIKRLQNQNHDLRQELDNINSKIGKGLVNQLQSKKDEGKSKDEGLGAKTLEQLEGEKDTPEDNVAGVEGEKPSLEAPVMMAKDNRTLEDIVAEYENDIKEKNNAQEQLEQFIGPQLFKELSEFERQEGEKEETKGEIDTQSAEKEKEPLSKKLLPKSKYDVVNKMAEEEKSLAAVLGDYENDLEALERENASLKKALEGVSGDGADLGEIISKYENQITILENANKEAENNFEDKHNELQNEIDDLRSTLEKLAQTLRQDFLDDLMKQDSDNHIEALQIMEKENKTLAEVLEEYEENMKKLEREKAVLQQIAGQGEEGASMLDTVNDYEDTIKGLKEVNKVLNKRIDALTDKIGPQLTKQIMDLCDKEKPPKTGGKDDKTKEEIETMAAVKEMEDKKITLEEVLKMYDDQNKKEIASMDSSDQPKISEKELDEKSEMVDDKKKADENVNNEAVIEGDKCKPEEASSAQIQGYTEKEKAAELIPEALYDKIGIQLIGDIKELDNKTYEELEKEDKRPYALRTMKARNEKLEDVIKAYENTLSNYGLLDTSALKEESLASELAAIEEDIAVDEGEQYGAKASDNVIVNKNDEENADGQDNDDDKQIEVLKKELEEEKTLKEKYQKDAEDLLNDIVKLKIKNASGEDVDEEEIEKQIKEEYEQKQENKHLKEDLSKEKEKNKELQDENNELKDEIRNMEKEIKNLEKAIEKMQGSAVGISDGDVDGKIKELLVKNENLEKELEALKNQLKENEENHKNEKNNLLQQSENEKRDTIKNLLDAKGEVEIKLQEQLALYHELEEKLKQTQEELDKLKSKDSETTVDNMDTEEISEKDDKLAQLKMRNESLKEQLDLSEESMKDALQKYQDAIKALEIEKAKLEDDKKHEIELLNNKLELEKAALERLKNDYDEMLKKEKERQMEDFEKDLEREKRRSHKDLEEQSEGFERKQNLHKQELQDAKEKAEKENAELKNSLEKEKENLQKMFDEQMRRKEEEYEKMLNQLREKLEDQMITEKAEMNVQFRQEKTELKTQIEKHIYGDELQKNIDLESDFQESLNKVLKDHTNEIEEIEKDMAQAEERFKDQKLELLEEFENEKLKETKQHEKEKQDFESTIENLLKEIIKLKHQRKEMRQQYRVEKQSIEEIADNERIEIQENTERSKNELVTKLKQDHEKVMVSEKEKYEVVIKELQEALERAEAKKKELEEKLRSESLKAEESLNNKSVNESSSEEVTREVKVIKRGIEMEYEQKLTIEKQRFEDTLQGLRREVGNLQEKRKIIQERVYNQETHSSERHVIEKSIANYKMEMLSKLEGEMAQRIDRERKPLEEEVKELQIENEELKRQRWEMKAQFRREKAALEEEFEHEKETLENNLNKEKEELRKRLEAKLQKEKHNKVFDVRVSRSTSPVFGEPSPRIDNTVRMLKQENLSLVSQNAKHEIDIEQLNEKLKFMDMNFKEMMETEKLKAEKMKKIQEQIPKAEVVDPTLPVPEYKPPPTGIKDDAILHNLQEKDQQIHQLLQTKKYYESVFGELCDEAGLFELDRNQIV